MEITGTSGTSSSVSETNSSLNGLGPDSFLKLLIAELQTQDPMSPMDTQAMVTQLSTMQMVSESRAARQSQDMLQAVSLLGRTVSWGEPGDSGAASGQVTGVLRDGSDPVLLVGQVQLKLDEIVAIS